MARCKGVNGRGEPCGSPERLVGDDGLCQAHREGSHMAERGQLGGAATRSAWKRPGVGPDELGALETVEDIQRWLRIIAGAVASGRLDKGDAQAAVKALDTWLKASDSLTEGDMERLAEKIAELQGGKAQLRRVP